MTIEPIKANIAYTSAISRYIPLLKKSAKNTSIEEVTVEKVSNATALSAMVGPNSNLKKQNRTPKPNKTKNIILNISKPPKYLIINIFRYCDIYHKKSDYHKN